MKRIIQTIIAISLPALSGFSQGTGGVFDFLTLPVSSRVEALGGENVSLVENDLSIVFHNPASLIQEMDKDVHLGFQTYPGGIKTGSVAFAGALGDYNAWGVGVRYVDYGTMQGTTIDNVDNGTFSVKDMSVNGFFSRDLTETWKGGVTAKVIYSAFETYTSLGLAVDLGLSYYDSDSEFSFGLTAKNLGRQLKAYHETLEPMPWDIQLGISKRLAHAPLRVSVTGVHLKQWQFKPLREGNVKEDAFFTSLFKHLVIGVDFLPSDNLWIAVGYNPKVAMDLNLEMGNKMGGFSMGAGLRVKAFNIGASVSRYHPSATSFHLNVTTSLGRTGL
ncbi:MAG: type IX secretion system protein PorQ [Dysgonamonadaceae bacterium]|jgi:hypothetical protein|nr:type IX secretion system protein PorQ [Dysgonamonadaceae bacterium]